VDLTPRPADPDLRRLRDDAVRGDRRRRLGNVAVGVLIGGLVLANALLVVGPVTGVASVGPMAGVDVTGFPLLGRDRASDVAEGRALPRAGAEASRGDRRSAGSAWGAAGPATASLPTWTGTAAPVDVAPATAGPTPTATTGSPTTATPTATAPAETGATGASDAPTSPTSSPTGTASTAALPSGLLGQVVDLVNDERAAADCPALAVDERLAEAAGAHAADMVDRQYFDHTSPDGSTPASRAEAAGYSGAVAENIATGYSTAVAVVEGWMDSPGHRANILDCDQRVTGVGHDPGSLPGYAPGTWVQVFGTG
jgi:uncharacterized protein YkwD